jgi:phosphoglycolate phosphatase
MIDTLNIPVEYVKEPIAADTLVLVDVQSGNRNLTNVCKSDNVFIIDHHTPNEDNKGGTYKGVIRSLGSCSTVIWRLMLDGGFDFDKDLDLSTALYYGLYTDTSRFDEISHPVDKDMRDELKFKESVFRLLRNNNLVLSELESVGDAFKNNVINTDKKFAIFSAKPCDPNILGVIADYALEVENVDLCIVYNELKTIYKLSVRSCTREIMAGEFIDYLTSGIGGGGGRQRKAAGSIDKDKSNALPDYKGIETLILERTLAYYNSFDVVDSNNHNLDVDSMTVYKKKKVPVFFAKSTDIFPDGTAIEIRTLEGDVSMHTSSEMYLMIGVTGEVYPIKADVWQENYELTDATVQYSFEYSPTVKNKQGVKDKVNSETRNIMEYVKPCIPTGERRIYAKKLERRTKVFTMWDDDGYLTGVPGDYLAVSGENKQDVYIINSDIFVKTYEN